MPEPRRWSEEEVEEILRRALERQQKAATAREGTSHEDLVAAAREVGIDAADVEAAASDLAREKAPRPQQAAPLVRRSPLRRFLRSAAGYAVVNAFLFALNQATGHAAWWHWVAIGWGIGLGFQALRLFFPTEDDARKEAHRAARDAERQERRARRHAQRAAAKEVEREFEEAVEAGVAALMGAVTRRIRAHIDPPKVRVEVDEPQTVETRAGTDALQEKRPR